MSLIYRTDEDKLNYGQNLLTSRKQVQFNSCNTLSILELLIFNFWLKYAITKSFKSTTELLVCLSKEKLCEKMKQICSYIINVVSN